MKDEAKAVGAAYIDLELLAIRQLLGKALDKRAKKKDRVYVAEIAVLGGMLDYVKQVAMGEGYSREAVDGWQEIGEVLEDITRKGRQMTQAELEHLERVYRTIPTGAEKLPDFSPLPEK